MPETLGKVHFDIGGGEECLICREMGGMVCTTQEKGLLLWIGIVRICIRAYRAKTQMSRDRKSGKE